MAGWPSSLRGGPPVIPWGPHAGSLLTPSPVLIKSHIYVSPVCMESPSPPIAWAGAAAPTTPGGLLPPLAAPQGPELLPYHPASPTRADGRARQAPTGGRRRGPAAHARGGEGAQPCSRACVPGSPSSRVGRGQPCLQGDHRAVGFGASSGPPLPVPRTGLHPDAPAALGILSLDARLAEGRGGGSRVLPGASRAQRSRLSRRVCW